MLRVVQTLQLQDKCISSHPLLPTVSFLLRIVCFKNNTSFSNCVEFMFLFSVLSLSHSPGLKGNVSLQHWLWDLEETRHPEGGAPGRHSVSHRGVACHFLLQGISWPRDQTCVSCIGGRFFTLWAIKEVLIHSIFLPNVWWKNESIWSKPKLHRELWAKGSKSKLAPLCKQPL